MILNHRIFESASAVQREAIRRDQGRPRDPRFDIPITMLLDLADDLFGPVAASADVDVQVEELHAGRPELGIPVVGADGAEEIMSLHEFVHEGAHVDAGGVTRRGVGHYAERAALDNCTNDAACDSDVHLSTCPRR